MINNLLFKYLAEIDIKSYNLNPLPKPGVTSDKPIETVMTFVFIVLGGVSLIVIMLAGIKFMTSQGDPQGIKKAREAIIYAAIGLVVAISASTILNFVVGRL